MSYVICHTDDQLEQGHIPHTRAHLRGLRVAPPAPSGDRTHARDARERHGVKAVLLLRRVGT
jgi:hypothetical protein